MNIRPFQASDYELIVSWWVAHDWAPIPLDLLPQTGLIVSRNDTPIASGFLYKTDSKFAIMEWILSDPKSDKLIRAECLNELIGELLAIAKRDGFRSVFTSVEHPKLIEKLLSNGFVKTDQAMTNLVRFI